MSIAVRLSGEPPGKGDFAVPSQTMPGESWTVSWITEGVCWCGCPAFQRRGICRHVQAVALAIESEARGMPVTDEGRAEAAARLHEIERLFSA